DILKKHHLQAPKTYEDLLKPEYKGLVAMPDPKSSGTGYFFYKNLVNNWGEEKTIEYIDKLSKNIKQFTESGSGPVKMLIQGEIAVGLGLTFQGVNELNNGNPFTLSEPE
ncbi:MAG: ABC transporter substrate-binding protein, partial [Erysipelotrichaceae bacterium]